MVLLIDLDLLEEVQMAHLEDQGFLEVAQTDPLVDLGHSVEVQMAPLEGLDFLAVPQMVPLVDQGHSVEAQMVPLEGLDSLEVVQMVRPDPFFLEQAPMARLLDQTPSMAHTETPPTDHLPDLVLLMDHHPDQVVASPV
jgi:hypothetical protein